MITEVKLLQQLKKEYDKHLVSALVGSGFTKNIYSKSPSWNELLKDLVLFAYESELQAAYYDYKHKTKRAKRYDKYLDVMVDGIIQRDGYLDVVSNFIKKKNCREAIDLYIEEKNPYFYIDKGRIKVRGDKKTEIDESKYETHKSFLECDWQQIFTTNFDNALETTSEICNLGYSTITNDYQLSREQLNNAIVKIHGNLVDREASLDFDEPFEFDGDKTRRYIISRDDFSTYFQKHQAFSYLLRIALLSGSYCLLGFSGDDPNFLGWLEWVKDILDKEPHDSIRERGEDSVYEQIKVFLILRGEDNIPDEKMLFFRNHHIGAIHLGREEIRQEIGCTCPNPSDGQLLQSLFSYLQKGNRSASLPNEENVPYYSLWRNVYDKLAEKAGHSIANDIAIIKEYRRRNRFVKSFAYQERVLDKLISIKSLSEEQKEIVICALKDLRIPLCQYSADVLSQFNTAYEWKEILTRESTFNGVFELIEEHSDFEIYENILRQLYCFNFDGAKSALNVWKPQGHWVTVKASVGYLDSRKDALDALDEYIKTVDNRTEKYIASTLYNCIDSQFIAARPVDKYNGLDGVSEMLHFYLQQIDKRKEDVLSYGQQQNLQTVEDTITNPQKYACRALHFIADLGLNTCYGILNVIDIHDWYKIFSYTYQYYPWPCLYYSAQYNNQKALKRIGQDYAYSESLSDVLPQMLTTALKCLTNHSIPAFMRFGLFQITGEFFVAIPETKWYSEFKMFLQRCFIVDGDKYIDYRDALRFVSLGLNSLLDPIHIADCFSILIEYFYVKSSDAIALICSHLRIKKLPSLDERLLKQIEKMMGSKFYNDSIYLVNYLNELKLLSNKSIYLKDIVEESQNIKALGMRPLLNLCILAKDNEDYRNVLKQEILLRDFWGKTKGSFVGGEEYFFRFTMLPAEYIFTLDERSIISVGLEKAFFEIQELRKPNQEMFVFFHQETIEEMNRYIDRYTEYFESNFIDTFKREYSRIHGDLSLEDALYCDTSEKIDSALSQVFEIFNTFTFDSIENLYNIAVQRLLIKHTVSNTYILYFVTRVLETYMGKILDSTIHTRNILRLVQTYSFEDLRVYNFQVVEAMSCFIRIATLLSKNGHDNDEYVRWWLNDEHINRFNYLDMFDDKEI